MTNGLTGRVALLFLLGLSESCFCGNGVSGSLSAICDPTRTPLRSRLNRAFSMAPGNGDAAPHVIDESAVTAGTHEEDSIHAASESAEGLQETAECTENLVMPDDAPAITSSDDHQLEQVISLDLPHSTTEESDEFTAQAAERAANVVRLAASRNFRKRWARRLRRGLPKNRRDCLDMAGKMPLSMWAR